VAGAGMLQINYKKREFEVDGKIVKEGDWISLDGSTGEVIMDKIETKPSDVLQVLIDKSLKPDDSKTFNTYEKIMAWADKYRKLRVRTNADQPDQSANAIAFGAEGIGLCRTEHMFFGGERITAVREMILSDTEEGRRKALAKLLPFQKEDFIEIFRVMKDRPVTVRTLDPPLHEFIPHEEKEQQELADIMNVPLEKLQIKVASLQEFNPMLGHRGCRLGIVYPEITEMQARAILEAACEVKKEGIDVKPEIMIPLVGHVNELRLQEELVRQVAAEVFEKYELTVDYLVGTMIELPRAAITAGEIAKVAEFFSFGTNDLTQTTFGLSRDDSGKFLPFYVEHDILPKDPFESVDQAGVGILMEWGVDQGRKTRKDIKIGICGEHGGDPMSIEFCHKINMNYVSCSPFRVPIARLAAAQAELKDKQ
jgi:pyruvate,orthophosphate dikinase